MPKKILTVCLLIVGLLLIILAATSYVLLSNKPAPVAATVEEQITRKIAAYDFSAREFETVDFIKAQKAAAIPVLQKLTADPDQKTRYVAYVAISGLVKENPELKEQLLPMLRKGLNDGDPSIKAQTAQLLLTFQETNALKTLIDLIDSNEIMMPSEPQTTVGEFAYLILIDATKLDLKKNYYAWSSWWEKNNEALMWNNDEQIFFAPVQ